MEILGRPRGLIAFTGERLWPQLDALAHWGESLTQIRWIAAYGEDESGGPVSRLQNFISHHFRHIDVEICGPIYDDDPEQAFEAVTTAASTGMDWLVDLSGGTRLMFTGGVLAGSQLDHVKVIYRQTDGPWYQLGTGRARQLEGLSARALDRFTVSSLLSVTWADAERVARVKPTRVEPEISNAATRTLNGQDWERQFTEAVAAVGARTGQVLSAGHLFETYVLNLVRQMGVAADDVAIGVTLIDGSTQIQEVDVVVNSHGRLHVIDCKLSNTEGTPRGGRIKAPPLGTQIREALTTKRQLADGGDQFIFLRPYLTMPEEFGSLCADYGLQVIDQGVLARKSLPDVLAQLIRPPARAT